MSFRSMEEFWPHYMNQHSRPATRRWHFVGTLCRNVPATFGHPFWSLLCDFKMFGLMLTGQMDREIKRLGKRPVLQIEYDCELRIYYEVLLSSSSRLSLIVPTMAAGVELRD
ncbi:hypothetical protein BC332_23561 [Capsicum chinense]|nr:hypothetical protein BC332_23561 [Capsicum chinense]